MGDAMIQFYILNGDNKRECTATDPAKAAQILALMFHSSKGYVVQDNKIVFAQNMSVQDAEVLAGIKSANAPAPTRVIVAPKSTDVKPTKPVKVKKPAKAKPKKAKVKSKVVVKAKPVKAKKPAKPTKKTKVKVKPKSKVNKKNGKVKNGKHR